MSYCITSYYELLRVITSSQEYSDLLPLLKPSSFLVSFFYPLLSIYIYIYICFSLYSHPFHILPYTAPLWDEHLSYVALLYVIPLIRPFFGFFPYPPYMPSFPA